MNIPWILLYVFALGAGLATVILSSRLSKTYQHKYLAGYFHFLTAFAIAGFLNLPGKYLAFRIFADLQPGSRPLVDHLFVLLQFPFMIFSFYSFTMFSRDLLEKKVSSVFKKFFFAACSALFLSDVLITRNFIDTRNPRLSGALFTAMNALAAAYYLFSAGSMFYQARDLKDPQKKKAVRLFSAAFWTGVAVVYIVSERAFGSAFGRPLPTIFLYFTFNLPPFLILKRYLDKFSAPLSFQSDENLDLERLFSEKDVSPREQQIIRLLLGGKSNKDIESELFISLHTVKNHVYKIYQKLGVKNRLQMMSLIRSYARNNAGTKNGTARIQGINNIPHT